MKMQMQMVVKRLNYSSNIAEPALFGVYAVDLLSRWRALRGFRKTLEDDHD
jgi:hypothetical protein